MEMSKKINKQQLIQVVRMSRKQSLIPSYQGSMREGDRNGRDASKTQLRGGEGMAGRNFTRGSEVRLRLVGDGQRGQWDEDSCSEFTEILTYTSAVQLETSSRHLAIQNKLVEEVRPLGQHSNKQSWELRLKVSA